MEENKKCFWHVESKRLRKEKGFIEGGCAIRWDTPCGGTPESVPVPHQCPGQYVTIEDVNKVNKELKTLDEKRSKS